MVIKEVKKAMKVLKNSKDMFAVWIDVWRNPDGTTSENREIIMKAETEMSPVLKAYWDSVKEDEGKELPKENVSVEEFWKIADINTMIAVPNEVTSNFTIGFSIIVKVEDNGNGRLAKINTVYWSIDSNFLMNLLKTGNPKECARDVSNREDIAEYYIYQDQTDLKKFDVSIIRIEAPIHSFYRKYVKDDFGMYGGYDNYVEFVKNSLSNKLGIVK